MKWPNGRALILAAGKGTRLLPVTKAIPKPLFPVLGIPAIERIAKILSIPGICQTAINVFHLKDQLIEWASSNGRQDRFTILEERLLLGTGGAVKNAFGKMGYDRPLLIYNSDIISNLDPTRLIECYYAMGAPASLLCVHHRSPFNKLCIKKGQVVGFDERGPSSLAYTGIAIISPELFRDVVLKPCSLVDIWQDAIEKGLSVKAIHGKEITRSGEDWTWNDIGTPCGYLKGNWTLLARSQERQFISSQAFLGKNLRLEGKIYIGDKAIIGDNTTIKDSIIWPLAEIGGNMHIENCTVTPYGTLPCILGRNDG